MPGKTAVKCHVEWPSRLHRTLSFVDPDARTLEAFEFREGHWVLLATLADDDPASQPPFDAITFPLGALWP